MKLTRAFAAISLLAMLMLLAGACGGGGDSGGSAAERSMIGVWGRTSGANDLPDTLILSGNDAGLAITDGVEAPFTWQLAGNVLINTVGDELNQATVIWNDDGTLSITDLTAGSGLSTWQRAE